VLAPFTVSRQYAVPFARYSPVLDAAHFWLAPPLQLSIRTRVPFMNAPFTSTQRVGFDCAVVVPSGLRERAGPDGGARVGVVSEVVAQSAPQATMTINPIVRARLMAPLR
jgi:hypothetical protein